MCDSRDDMLCVEVEVIYDVYRKTFIPRIGLYEVQYLKMSTPRLGERGLYPVEVTRYNTYIYNISKEYTIILPPQVLVAEKPSTFDEEQRRCHREHNMSLIFCVY